jgi:hypothetical protein
VAAGLEQRQPRPRQRGLHPPGVGERHQLVGRAPQEVDRDRHLAQPAVEQVGHQARQVLHHARRRTAAAPSHDVVEDLVGERRARRVADRRHRPSRLLAVGRGQADAGGRDVEQGATVDQHHPRHPLRMTVRLERRQPGAE